MTEPEGDDLRAAISQRAQDLAAGYCADAGVFTTETARLWLDIGIASGAAATMQELIDRGVIDGDRAI